MLCGRTCRCPMHAFSLATCAMLGFPWARAVTGLAQQLAIHFSLDSAATVALAAAAAQLGLASTVVPASLSQVHSVHTCLRSLLALQTAIRQAMVLHPFAAAQTEVELNTCVLLACGRCALVSKLAWLALAHKSCICMHRQMQCLHWTCLCRLQVLSLSASLPVGQDQLYDLQLLTSELAILLFCTA